MKKIQKIILSIILIFILFSMLSQVKASDFWGVGKDFINLGEREGTVTIDASKFEPLIDFLWGLGLLVIAISTVILGIKYMLVDPAEKSKIKQATTPYVIGVIIIFGALSIWKFVIFVLEGSL